MTRYHAPFRHALPTDTPSPASLQQIPTAQTPSTATHSATLTSPSPVTTPRYFAQTRTRLPKTLMRSPHSATLPSDRSTTHPPHARHFATPPHDTYALARTLLFHGPVYSCDVSSVHATVRR